MTEPGVKPDTNQHDVVDSVIGFGVSSGVLWLIFIGMMVAEYIMK
jgi:hypothetical protein